MRELPQAATPILRRIIRLARKEHRDVVGQLQAMTELYEKTHNVSGKVERPKQGKYKKIKSPAPQEEKIDRRRGPRSQEIKDKLSAAQKGRKQSEAAREKRSWSMKLSHARKRIAELQAKQ